MKRFRPRCAGFIVLYVLAFLSLVDMVYTIYRQAKGAADDFMGGFSFFSYVVFALAMCYVWMYARCQVAIDGKKLRIAFPANVRPKEGEGRAMFIFRQGDTDMKFIDKTIRLDTVTRYGYVEDLGYQRIDAGQAGENNKLFPVHEVAFITSENKRYHLNAAFFSQRQRKEMFELIRKESGVAPEGKLEVELRV